MDTIKIIDAPTVPKKRPKQLITHRAFAERNDVSPRTIDRWTEVGRRPKPIRIRRRKYWKLNTKPRADPDAA